MCEPSRIRIGSSHADGRIRVTHLPRELLGPMVSRTSS